MTTKTQKYVEMGLNKIDNVVTFEGKGIDDLPKDSARFLANYGLFVHMTRALAGKESYSVPEKIKILKDDFSWLEEGMPKRHTTSGVALIKAALENAEAKRLATEKELAEARELIAKLTAARKKK